MRAKPNKEARSALGAALGRLKKGVIERKSAQKAVSSRKALLVALAVKRGNFAEADRLRWLFFPERRRGEKLAEQIGRDRAR